MDTYTIHSRRDDSPIMVARASLALAALDAAGSGVVVRDARGREIDRSELADRARCDDLDPDTLLARYRKAAAL